MQKTLNQTKRWMAACLSMMLIITGLVPFGKVLAAADVWTISNPTTISNSPADDTKLGTAGTPVKAKNRILPTIALTNTNPVNPSITVKINSATFTLTTPATFGSNSVTLKDIPLNVDGSVTKVELLSPGLSTATMYYQYVPKSPPGPTTFVFNNIPKPDGGAAKGSSVDPIIVKSSRTISGLTFDYTGDTNDTKPEVQVLVNGVIVQRIYSTGNGITVNPFDLTPGLNTVRILSYNSGYEAKNTVSGLIDVYYDFQPTNSPIILTDYPGQGTSITNALLYSDPAITLNGIYGAGVVGSNLRLKITTNNGANVQDLSSTAPAVNQSASTFSFKDVTLQPGLNVITFYEKMGAVTREHYKFYVEYNSTPFIDELKINDTPLTSATTLITVPSTNRLNLNMEGIAKNAKTVTVTNVTTGATVDANVSGTSSTFSLSLPSQLGRNDLQITAKNLNKTVGVINRSIHVVTSDPTDSHQIYNLTAKNLTTNKIVTLTPGQVATISSDASASGGLNTAKFQFDGTALLQHEDITNVRRIIDFKMTFKEQGTGNTWSVSAIPPGAGTSKGNGFTQYSVLAVENQNTPLPVGAYPFTDGNSYTVSFSYQYETYDSIAGAWATQGYVPITNYAYQFKYIDSSKPNFTSVKYNGNTLIPNAVNTVGQATLKLNVTAENMTVDTTKLFVYYEGNALTSPTQYDITNVSTPTGSTTTTFDLKLTNLPSGTGDLLLTYDDGTNPKTSVLYRLNVQNAPYIQLTYVDGSGQIRSFEDGYQIQSDSDFHNLSGKVFNYDLNKNNITVKVNSKALTVGDPSDSPARDVTVVPSAGSTLGTFVISQAAFSREIKAKGKGNHTLEISLTTQPGVTYTYNILYVTSKAPTIEDIKLETIQNGKSQELVKKAADPAYQTGAYFLSDFSFTVKDASHLYIEKNGKRIADYRYNNGDWDLQQTNQEYIDTLSELPSSRLKSDFTDSNFESKSKTKFEASMKSTEYGDLIEDVQNDVKDPSLQEQKLTLFPLTLKKDGSTVYTIVAEDDTGAILRYNVTINQNMSSWEVISPVKVRETDQYIIVNSNSVPIKVFAENATKVLFGKTEAKVTNTTERDFQYNDKLGKVVPETYYVFTATVPLKKGLNTVKYTVQVGSASYNDQVLIFNANSAVDGAEYRDVLGKKTSFSVFEKALDLKFPSGTVLLTPSAGLAGEEVKNPSGDIFIDVPLYFGIADRTTGQVVMEGSNLKPRLTLESNFGYASPLYYIDAGDTTVPGGRDPYFKEGDADDFKTRYHDNLVPSRKGTIAIKYDPSIVNAANNILTIFYNNGEKWTNLGGVVNTGAKTVSVPFEGFGFYMVMKTRESFDDVVTHDFARDAMETLYAKGIMPNYSGSSFGANRDMTRGEFATMIVKALNLPLNAGPFSDDNHTDPIEPSFSDVRPSRDTWDYQYEYIETAARAGIVRGKEPGYFRPSESLTREEAAIMIARALNLKMTGSPELAKANLTKLFTDGKDVSYYAALSTLAVTKAKLMSGEPNDPAAKKPTYRFLPRSNLSRAEMAVITIRVMVQLKKLPKQ